MDGKALKAAYQMIIRTGALEAFKLAWCRETARPDQQPFWDEKNPMRGQCDATALVIEGLVGGEILACDVAGYGRHYYNLLSDGTELDLTVAQFPPMTPIPRGKKVEARVLLRGPESRKLEVPERVELLNEMFIDALEKIKEKFDNLGTFLP